MNAQQAQQAGRRARIVRHARLMPACEGDAAQMRFAVEDALNTADFGDAGRLVLVRRLRLVDLPPRASPALVARALESAWRAMASRAVPAAHPSAAGSDAVFFASRFEARMAWLAKAVGGEAPAQWFWPAALPELKALPPASSGAAIGYVVEAALLDGEAAVASALKRWQDAPLVALARAMPVGSQRRLLRVLASSQGTASAVHALAVQVPAAKAWPQPLAIVAQRLAAWAPMDEGPASLLAALWLEPELHRAPSVEEVRAVASRAAWIASRARAGSADRERRPQGSPARMADSEPTGIADASPAGEGALDAPPELPAAEPARPGAATAAAAQPSPWKIESGLTPQARPFAKAKAPRLAPQPAWPWLADAAFTRFGGLMLVLNVLGALRFGRWLESVDAGDRLAFVQALLHRCLDGAGAAEDEPQRAWLGEAAARPQLRLWTARLRRALRRHARLDLADLVRRPGWVSATPTHIDVIFAMDDVDLRLRRLGLDADPGWVPWFGRIVNFHFIDAQLLPPAEEEPHG